MLAFLCLNPLLFDLQVLLLHLLKVESVFHFLRLLRLLVLPIAFNLHIEQLFSVEAFQATFVLLPPLLVVDSIDFRGLFLHFFQ